MRYAWVFVAVGAAIGCGSSPTVPSVATRPVTIVATPPPPPPPVEPPKLHIVEQALDSIDRSYLDTSRIVPRTMLRAALRGLESESADVSIEDVEHGVVVHVDDKHQAFELDGIDSLAAMTSRLRSIVGFIQTNPGHGKDTAALEYAAINGMLATLDPHSLLLDPKTASEFSTQVAGKFGGVGLSVEMRKNAAGVMAVAVTKLFAKDMPAAKAGLAVDDLIISIDDQSTAAFTLEDAIGHLRGAPDTKVKLVIERAGVATPTTYVLTRAVIRISPVHSRLVGRRVGYIQIDHFSKGVGDDVIAAIDQLRSEGARGWILDLRHNPGGLLAESTKVVDQFVGAGTIITTLGRTEREDVTAAASPHDDHAPLVVLVDESTASAAEVATGALKYLDRAVVMGSTTFGKGSVQVMYDLDDGSKLKLTVAQYVFTNDISLQAVGIAPDLELDPVLVPAQQVSAHDVLQLGPRRIFHEADLEAHLTSSRAIPLAKPTTAVRYLGAVGDAPDATDFALQLSSELVASTSRADRRTLVAEAKKRAEAARPREDVRIAAALGKIGIDWKPGPDKPGAKLAATCTTDLPSNKLVAGGTVSITCVATNGGTAAAYQVRAHARSDDDTFDGIELVFGVIAPGASKTATVRVDVPDSAESRRDVLVWTYGAQHDVSAETASLALTIDGAPTTKPAPRVVVDEVAPITADDHVKIHGSATGRVDDVVIRLSNHDAKLDDNKIWFRSNRAGTASVELATDVKLLPGSNLITIVARGSDHTQTIRKVSIFRSR